MKKYVLSYKMRLEYQELEIFFKRSTLQPGCHQLKKSESTCAALKPVKAAWEVLFQNVRSETLFHQLRMFVSKCALVKQSCSS